VTRSDRETRVMDARAQRDEIREVARSDRDEVGG